MRTFKTLEELYDREQQIRIEKLIDKQILENKYYRQLCNRLIRHPSITLDIVLKIPRHIIYDYIDLSQHPNITWDIIQDNKDIPWNWKYISLNPNITFEIIQENPSHSWDWHNISKNPNITWKIIQDNKYKPWDWSGVSQNPNITWDIIINNLEKKWDIPNIFKHPNITWDMIQILVIKYNIVINNYNLIYISQNPNITVEIIKENMNYKWPCEWLSENPNMTMEFILENLDKNWSWYDLSKNPNITFDDIKKTLDPHKANSCNWVWEKLSNNPNITWDIVNKNPQYNWYKSILDTNPMPKQKEEWINKKRLEIIAANIIHRYWRLCTFNPEYTLARKLVLQKAGY